MPTLSREEVQRLARLARLQLTADEIDLFARQLGDILEFARQIESVDTASVGAPAPLSAAVEALRDDALQPCLDRDAVLSRAPGADRTAGLFKVPRVLNG
ncbi:MAG TPA: Asp-tRNA(Asn)/Glu-tRNA(Gln) amidotransferase subunit GatC [Vicinamibacterales bacterium]|nr:Asp-tRNA(Asn)/Glu-tRNA(Gln) amidotransferase subunit GatC [Vicinamibacterales bacterium]